MATPTTSPVPHPIILEGRTIETAPLSAPQPRFKAQDIAFLHITVHDGVTIRSSAGFNPGTCYMTVPAVGPGVPTAAPGATSFCPGVVKAVSWDSSQGKHFVLPSLAGVLANGILYWLPEDQGGLLKPMYEVGDKVTVRTACHQFYLLATILERNATLDLRFDIGYKVDISTLWVEEMKIVRGIDGETHHMENNEKYAARLKASGRDTSDLGAPTLPLLISHRF